MRGQVNNKKPIKIPVIKISYSTEFSQLIADDFVNIN